MTALVLLSASCLICLAMGQSSLANAAEHNKIYSCTDSMSGQLYLTNIKSSVPENCQNLKVMTVPTYKQSNENTGLRETEKAQLLQIEKREAQIRQTHMTRYQQIDEKIGTGVYGSWLDNRQDQCYAYQARVEEARADRKDDVKLNRQIQRDLAQINYYCR